jgi:hypothetical protein
MKRGLTLGLGRDKIHKILTPINAGGQTREFRRLELPGRTEVVVRLSVEGTTKDNERLTEKRVIQEGLYLAGAITKVQSGCAITSIVNTTDEYVEIEEPVLRVTKIEPGTPTEPPGDSNTWRYSDRSEEVLND